MSIEQNPCRTCKENGHVTVRMRNLSGKGDRVLYGIVVCPACLGKKYTDATDMVRVQSPEQYDQIV